MNAWLTPDFKLITMEAIVLQPKLELVNDMGSQWITASDMVLKNVY